MAIPYTIVGLDLELPEVVRDLVRNDTSKAVAALKNGRLAEVNDTWCKLFGYPSGKEIIGQQLPTAPPVESHGERPSGSVDLGSSTCVHNFIRKDGSVFQVDMVTLTWPYDPAITIGIGTDVTVRERNVEALRKSEELFRHLADSLPAGVTMVGRTGKRLYVNDEALRLTGYSREEYLAGALRFHPDDAETDEMYSRALQECRSETGLEIRLVRKDGTDVWVSASWQPIRDALGRRHGLCIAFTDLTERKFNEEALLRANVELERAHQLQREFLNNVTHEVRTPLTAVKGYAMMLLEEMAGPINSEQESLLKKVLASSDSLLDIVGGVLEIVRLKCGTMTLRPKVCKPSQILLAAVDVVLPQAREKHVEINVTNHRRESTGMYDEEKLAMILTNLLSNAVKFSKPGGQIEVHVKSNAQRAKLLIIDYGVGIRTRDLGVIFDEFRQLDHPGKHKPAGFGLGLAIVANLADMIGATITVSSRRGIGTAFALDVPSLRGN